MCLTKNTRVRQLIVKQTSCLPFVQVAPKCLPFAQDTTKQRYLSRKATMGIFELYERSHIKRYIARRSHVKKPSAKSGGGRCPPTF